MAGGGAKERKEETEAVEGGEEEAGKWNWVNGNGDVLRVVRKFLVWGLRKDGSKEMVPLEVMDDEKAKRGFQKIILTGKLVKEPLSVRKETIDELQQAGMAVKREESQTMSKEEAVLRDIKARYELRKALRRDLALKIVDGMLKDELSEPFSKPVDAEAMGLKDYHEIVKEPMDLGTIRSNVENGVYQLQFSPFEENGGPAENLNNWVDPERFIADMKLVFSNCLAYNPPEADIVPVAKKLSEKRGRLWWKYGTKNFVTVNREGDEMSQREVQQLQRAALLEARRLIPSQGAISEKKVEIEDIEDYMIEFGVGIASSSLYLIVEENDQTIYYRIAMNNFLGGYTPNLKPARKYKSFAIKTMTRFHVLTCLVHEIRTRLESEGETALNSFERPVNTLLKCAVWCNEVGYPLRPNAYIFFIENAEFIRNQVSQVDPTLESAFGIVPFIMKMKDLSATYLERALPLPPPKSTEDEEEEESPDEVDEEEEKEHEEMQGVIADRSGGEEVEDMDDGEPVHEDTTHVEEIDVQSFRAPTTRPYGLPIPRPMEFLVDPVSSVERVSPEETEFEDPELFMLENDLLGRRVEVLSCSTGTWNRGTVLRYRPSTKLHLVKYDDSGDLEWFKLDRKNSYWKLLRKNRKAQVHAVIRARHNPLQKVIIPPSLMSLLAKVHAFFQSFSDQLSWNLPTFTLAEFAAAVMTKDIKTDRNSRPQPVVAELLMAINLELIHLCMEQSTADSRDFRGSFAQMYRELDLERPHTILKPTSKDEGSLVRWSYDQMDRAIADIPILSLMQMGKRSRRFAKGASWQSLKAQVHSMTRDVGWFATTPEFLQSLTSFYVSNLKWDPKVCPRVFGESVNLYAVYTLVKQNGGFRVIESKADPLETWVSMAEALPQLDAVKCGTKQEKLFMGEELQSLYKTFLLHYERAYTGVAAHAFLRFGVQVLLRNGDVIVGAPIGLPLALNLSDSVGEDVVDLPEEPEISSGDASLKRSVSLGNFSKDPAYLAFVQDRWDRSVSFEDTLKALAVEWEHLDDAQRGHYETIATQKEARVADYKEIIRVGRALQKKTLRRNKRKNADSCRKRGRTAFSFFVSISMRRNNGEVGMEGVEQENRKILKENITQCGEHWKTMSKAEKQPYYDLACEDAIAVEEEKRHFFLTHPNEAQRQHGASELLSSSGFSPSLTRSGNSEMMDEVDAVFNPLQRSRADEGREIRAKMKNAKITVADAPLDLTFVSVNDLTWQELLLELLCRINNVQNPRSHAAVRVNDPTAAIELHNEAVLSQEDLDAGPDESENNEIDRNRRLLSDVNAYNLEEEESKDLAFWNIKLGEDAMNGAEFGDAGEGGTVAEVMEECERLIDALISHPLASPFVLPVNDSEPGLGAYYKTVEEPMSLSEILERLRAGFYNVKDEEFEFESFCDDMQKIWTASKIFNSQGSNLYEDAVRFEDMCKDRLGEIQKLDQALKAGRPERVKAKVNTLLTTGEEALRMHYESFVRSFPEEKLPGGQKSQVQNEEMVEKAKIKYPKKKLGRYAITKLMEDPESEAFREPVDTSLPGLEDYTKIIAKPIDLGTIQERLETGHYDYYASRDKSTLAPKFSKDVKRVFDNCVIFNDVKSEIGKAATRLLQKFMDIILNPEAIESTDPNEDSPSMYHRFVFPEGRAPLLESVESNSGKSAPEVLSSRITQSHFQAAPTASPAAASTVFDAAKFLLEEIASEMDEEADAEKVKALLRELEQGNFSIDERGELGFLFAKKVREVLPPKALETFDSKYASILSTHVKNKWAWVGEHILWLDTRIPHPCIREGFIVDFYAPPKFKYKNMNSKNDFWRLRVQYVDKTAQIINLNLWTKTTIAFRPNKGLGSYAAMYGEGWVFLNDSGAAEAFRQRQVVRNANSSRAQHHGGEDNGDEQELAGDEEDEDADDEEDDDEDGESPQKNFAPSRLVEFWDPLEVAQISSIGTAHPPSKFKLLEQLMNREYATLEPHVKLLILETLCEHVVRTYPVRLGIAMALGLQLPSRFEAEELDGITLVDGRLRTQKPGRPRATTQKKGKNRNKTRGRKSRGRPRKASFDESSIDDENNASTSSGEDAEQSTKNTRKRKKGEAKTSKSMEIDEDEYVPGQEQRQQKKTRKDMVPDAAPIATEAESNEGEDEEITPEMIRAVQNQDALQSIMSEYIARESGVLLQQEVEFELAGLAIPNTPFTAPKVDPEKVIQVTRVVEEEDENMAAPKLDVGKSAEANEEISTKQQQLQASSTSAKREGSQGTSSSSVAAASPARTESVLATEKQTETKAPNENQVIGTSQQNANASAEGITGDIDEGDDKEEEEEEEEEDEEDDYDDDDDELASLSFKMEMSECKEKLTAFMAEPCSAPFNVPVDAEFLGLPTYHKIIKKPMDFGTIWNKLNQGAYNVNSSGSGETIVGRALLYDAEQIFENCLVFNRDGSQMYNAGLVAEAKFNEIFCLTDGEFEVDARSRQKGSKKFRDSCRILLQNLISKESQFFKRMTELTLDEKRDFNSVKGLVSIEQIFSRLESDHYDEEENAQLTRAMRRGSSGKARLSQKAFGFARDMRNFFQASKFALPQNSEDAQAGNRLSSEFERKYARLLVTSTQNRICWLGETTFIVRSSGNVQPAHIAGTAFSNHMLAFRMIMRDGSHQLMQLWTENTYKVFLRAGGAKVRSSRQRKQANYDVSALPPTFYGRSWVFANDVQGIEKMDERFILDPSGKGKRAQEESMNKLSHTFKGLLRKSEMKRVKAHEAEEDDVLNMELKITKRSGGAASRKAAQDTSILEGDLLAHRKDFQKLGIRRDDEIRFMAMQSDAQIAPRALRALEGVLWKTCQPSSGAHLRHKAVVRYEPVGFDRHGSRYWHFSRDNLDIATDADGIIFIELTPLAVSKLLQNPESWKDQGRQILLWNASQDKMDLWCAYVSLSQIHGLLSALERDRIPQEKHLAQNLLLRYGTIIMSAKRGGTAYVGPLSLESKFDSSRVHCYKLSQLDLAHFQVTLSQIVFDGAPILTKDLGNGSRPEKLLRGDVLISINGRPTLHASLEEIKSMLHSSASEMAVVVYRPVAEAILQSLALCEERNSFVTQFAPSNVVSRVIPKLAATPSVLLEVLMALEAHLWSIGTAEPRILSTMEEWRWLHGWGSWKWPFWRADWHSRVSEAARALALGEAEESAIEDQVVAGMKTVCRAYISTMPPVKPRPTTEGSERLDAAVNKLLDVSTPMGLLPLKRSSDMYKISAAIFELPGEADWRRELQEYKSWAHLGLLLSWMYVEVMARFSSALLSADEAEARSLNFQKLKTTTVRNLRNIKLNEASAWARMKAIQDDIRKCICENLTPAEFDLVNNIRNGLKSGKTFDADGDDDEEGNGKREQSEKLLVEKPGSEEPPTPPSNSNMNGESVGKKRRRKSKERKSDEKSSRKKAKKKRVELDPNEKVSIPDVEVEEEGIDEELVSMLDSYMVEVKDEDDVDSDTEAELSELLARRPKRRSAWVMFTIDGRKKLKCGGGERYSNLDITQTTRLLQENWKMMPKEEKEKWKKKSRDYNDRNEEVFSKYDRLAELVEKARDERRTRPRRQSKPFKLAEETKVLTSGDSIEASNGRRRRYKDVSHKSKSEHSIFNGIYQTRGRWRTEVVCPDGQVRLVGRYDSEVSAAVACDQALRLLYPLKIAEAAANLPHDEVVAALRGKLPSIDQFKVQIKLALHESAGANAAP